MTVAKIYSLLTQIKTTNPKYWAEISEKQVTVLLEKWMWDERFQKFVQELNSEPCQK